LSKTNERLNIENNQLIDIKYIYNLDNFFEYTENFDAKFTRNNKIYYFNLKFICSDGGFQTRILREVYHFIKIQHNFLLNISNKNIYIINILDGVTSYKYNDKIKNIQNKDVYCTIKNNIFIGDLYTFQKNKHIYSL